MESIQILEIVGSLGAVLYKVLLAQRRYKLGWIIALSAFILAGILFAMKGMYVTVYAEIGLVGIALYGITTAFNPKLTNMRLRVSIIIITMVMVLTSWITKPDQKLATEQLIDMTLVLVGLLFLSLNIVRIGWVVHF